MRGLKSLVIVLGVLLVGGTLTLVTAIVWRGPHAPPGTVSAGRPAATANVAYESTIPLAQGAEIVSVTAAGDRLIVQLRSPGARQQLLIVDMGSGARLGTIEFRPDGPGSGQ